MLALEYIAKLFIYMIVIVVVVALVLRFFMKTKICLFDCKEEVGCKVETTVVEETEITDQTIDKYCYLCWEKNDFGKCRSNSLCYVVRGYFYPTSYLPEKDYCEIKCDREATSLLFLYDYVRGKVFVEC